MLTVPQRLKLYALKTGSERLQLLGANFQGQSGHDPVTIVVLALIDNSSETVQCAEVEVDGHVSTHLM